MRKFYATLGLMLAVLATACAPDPVDAPKSFSVQQKASSATSATIVWEDEYSIGGEESYKIVIYEKNSTSTPYQSYTVEMKEGTPRAFTFPLLEPSSRYSVTVTNQANVTTNMLTVSTPKMEVASASDIVFQNFDYLCWGYDYMNEACGVKMTLTASYAPETLEDTIAKWTSSSSLAYDIKLSNCSQKIISLIGLSNWGFDNAYIRPGYIRLGSSSSAGKLYTPGVKLLPDDGSDIIVDFKACPFATTNTDTDKTITVKHIDSEGNVITSQELEVKGYDGAPKWRAMSVTFKDVMNGHKFLFETSEGNAMCIDNINAYFESDIDDDEVFGYITDNFGNPVIGVAVSDGFTVVKTDNSGLYHFMPSPDAYYIFISMPAEYKMPIDSKGRPGYFQRYRTTQKQYDFKLEQLENGREKEFMLFGFADPQTGSDAAVQRFIAQVVPEVKSYSSSLGIPCYGITLGDVISMGGSKNEEYMFYDMRDAMHANKMGMPVFQVMGNHDNRFMSASKPIRGNDLRDINLKIQRSFEDAFGPVNFSFNRGGAHIIGMRDVQWKSGDNCATANTSTVFTEDQYKWLVQDLACVDNKESKLVILCVHVPLYNKCTKGDGTYRQEILSLLDQFGEAHILSGHTHYQQNYDHQKNGSSHKIYEHVQAAVNGASWSSNINGDGVPNGYGVYHISNNTIKDWYYKGYAKGMNTRDYQIRLYRGNAITGAASAVKTDSSNTEGYYQFGYGENDLLANVFNSDTSWRVEVYEDGVFSGTMNSLSKYHWDVTYDELIGTGSLVDPMRPPVGAECGRDFWAVGVLLGKLGYNTGSLYYKHCYQLWRYTLKNKNAAIEVRATDRKGNVYKCSKITEGTDSTNALYN